LPQSFLNYNTATVWLGLDADALWICHCHLSTFFLYFSLFNCCL